MREKHVAREGIVVLVGLDGHVSLESVPAGLQVSSEVTIDAERVQTVGAGERWEGNQLSPKSSEGETMTHVSPQCVIEGAVEMAR